MESALRNLNGVDLGGRALRLDYDKNSRGGKSSRFGREEGGGDDGQGGESEAKAGLGELAGSLESLSSQQRRDYISKMRTFLEVHPDDAAAVLRENPTLAWAYVQILTLEDLLPNNVDVDAFVVNEPQPAFPPPPNARQGAPGPGAPPPHPPPGGTVPMAGVTPIPPPPSSSVPTSPAAGLMQLLANVDPKLIYSTLGEQNTQLLTSVLSMTQEQYAALSSQQRSQIDAIQQQLATMFR